MKIMMCWVFEKGLVYNIILQNFTGTTCCLFPGAEEGCAGWVVSSESCSFGAIGARFYREVLPGNGFSPVREHLCSIYSNMYINTL